MKTKVILSLIATLFSLSVSASHTMNTSSSVAALDAVTTSACHRTLYVNNDLADSIKWECDLDEQGRVVTKAGYVLNAQSGEWIPRVAYSVFYGQDETIVTTAKWDASRGSFRSGAVQQKYAAGYVPEYLKIK